MENEKKNTVLLIVIAIATLLVAVVGATFAYFASTTTATNQLTVNVTTGKTATFTSSSSDLIELGVTSESMQKSSELYGIAAEDNGTIEISYVAGGNQTMTCTYSIYYEWDDGSVPLTGPEAVADGQIYQYVGPNGYTVPYVDATAEPAETYDHELSLAVNAEIQEGENSSNPYGVAGSGVNYLSTADTEVELVTLGDVPEVSLTGEETADEEAAIKASALANVEKRLVIKDATIDATNAGTTIVYTFDAKFYNIPANQTLLSDKTFKGHFTVEADC